MESEVSWEFFAEPISASLSEEKRRGEQTSRWLSVSCSLDWEADYVRVPFYWKQDGF